MEKKTYKAKLEIFKFFQNRKAILIKLAEIVPSIEINKYTLTRVFLHAEFISAMLNRNSIDFC